VDNYKDEDENVEFINSSLVLASTSII